ncbi:MAG: hypothetical protein FWG66_14150 [Spirochaetes bacterium]|nr:hypothetical protein [Spirochaetota bacterium]
MMPCDFEQRQKENAEKAEEAAGRLFPGEKWIKWEEGIYLSERRKRGRSFGDEIRNAQILRDLGSTVYLAPENTRLQNKRQYDAIVDGEKMEFKNMSGGSVETLIKHFYRSRGQAPNVFINLEESPLSKGTIIRELYGARSSPKYDEKNKFPEGGTIVLKIKGDEELCRMDVDDIK